MTKQEVIDSLNEMPSAFKLDELVERLIVIEKIDKALEGADDEGSISSEELKDEIKKWQK